MSREEAREILDRFKNWNTGQKSLEYSMYRERTREDDIFDARRELILAATKTLSEES